jgi:hypothetical protein
MWFVRLWTNRNYSLSLHNVNRLCLLLGMNWIFKYVIQLLIIYIYQHMNINLIKQVIHKQNSLTCFSNNFLLHGSATPSGPSGPGPPHYRSTTTILRHTTLGKAPLDKWSARLRNLYLTNNTHKRPSCPQRDSKPQSQQANSSRPMPQTAWPLRSASTKEYIILIYQPPMYNVKNNLK